MGKFLLFPQDGKVRVTSPFGMRNGSMHRGVDVASDNIGVDWNLAAADGAVTLVSYQAAGAGHYLTIKVDFPINGKVAYIRYFHLKERPRFYDRPGQPMISAGDRVRQGEKIGIEGNTGHSAGAHLHFELLLGGNTSAHAVDPVPHLWIPKALPVDPGQLTQTQFKRIRYVEDYKEDGEVLVLKMGSKGEEVKAVQAALISLGYPLGGYAPTGNYLEITEATVKKFQADTKIGVDGEVGSQTTTMLLNKLAEKASSAAKAKELAAQIVKL